MSSMFHVMVVDDDPSMCEFLQMFLSSRGYQPLTMPNAEEAVRRYQEERPAAVILDLTMPGRMDGFGALEAFKKIDCHVPVIVVSGTTETTAVVHAMKLGAQDFISKPFDESDLEGPLASAIKQQAEARETSAAHPVPWYPPDEILFGHGDRMAEVRDLIECVADTDVTVLVRGESGTGKELIARALHAVSLRGNRPFLKVNCAALPADLLESELFGFERGAFTGAVQHKPGKFEFANHGTMFLDEIGELGVPLQAKLLQVLQDGEFSRLGGKRDVHVDVRIIAATNRDLEAAVGHGSFREDLFFRLNVVVIALPALRERRGDIPRLVEYLLAKYSAQYHKPHDPLTRATLDLIMAYDWPGNVRELENLIKRAVILGAEEPIKKGLINGSVIAAHRAFAATVTAAPAAAFLSPPASVTTPASASLPGAMQTSETPLAVAGVAASHDAIVSADVDSLDLVDADAAQWSLKEVSRQAAREAERELILRMLQHTRWNRKETAEILGISYKALLYKIKENGLDPKHDRA